MNTDRGELDFYYLKEVDTDSYRPYDLRVVSSSEAGSEHFVFYPHAVLHVTQTGYGGMVTLAEWYRESVLWETLHNIAFFRCFTLRKAFTQWHQNVRRISFQRKGQCLQDTLLLAVPQFRKGLLFFISVIEELKGTHWLPQEESKTYTLLEFKDILQAKKQECQHLLEKLSQCRTVVLHMVKEDCYKSYHELQCHIEYAEKPNRCYESIHLHMAHQQELKRDLTQAENTLGKLGSFAGLIDQMVIQSLATLIHQDAINFLNSVLKREMSQQRCLFQTELIFSADDQLTVDPPLHFFQNFLSDIILTAKDSIIQMCDTCGFFLEIPMKNPVASQDISYIKHHTDETKSDERMSGRRMCCSWQLLRNHSAHSVLPENQPSVMIHGQRMKGCYRPLCRRQLEWHFTVSNVVKQVEEEYAGMTQEAESDIQQLYQRHTWLTDIHLFISQWSQASLDSMIGQPAVLYEQHIQMIHNWIKRIHTLPSSVSTANQLFIIHCTNVKSDLEQQLKITDEAVLKQLVEQIKLLSEGLMLDLERNFAELEKNPQDLHSLSQYALKVRESEKMLADSQKRLEYIHCLQDIICMKYRKMSEEELRLEEQMQGLWSCNISILKRAESIVSQYLPSSTNALGTMFSFLIRDLKKTVNDATHGPYLDPSQNAKDMVSKLNPMCIHLQTLKRKLEELSRRSDNLTGNWIDLTNLTEEIQKVEARKELWELLAVCTTWIQEWKKKQFSEVVVSEAQRKNAEWREKVLSLSNTIPASDAVLQETLRILENLGCQLPVMAKILSPELKQKHLKAILQGMDLLFVPEKKLTAADLMSQQLQIHHNLIDKIWCDARAECDMESTFQNLQRKWESCLLQMEVFTGAVTETQTDNQHSCSHTRRIIIGLEIHLAETENDLMTLSNMLNSPHSVGFRMQIEDWVQLLRELEKLLHLFERFQQIWSFLTKVLYETTTRVWRMGLLEQFRPVDETFKEMMQSISNDPRILTRVHSKTTNGRFHGESLCQILISGLTTMEAVSNQMLHLLDSLCDQFPRLRFLSDREVKLIYSLQPSPATMLPFVRKLFKGVQDLEVDCEKSSDAQDQTSCGATSNSQIQMKVLGFFGSLQEKVTFSSPLETNLSPIVWFCDFERQLKLTMEQLLKQCAIAQNQLDLANEVFTCEKKIGDILNYNADQIKKVLAVLNLLCEYPLQCVLVAEEAAWCNVMHQASQESNPVKLSDIKAYNSVKLKNLGRFIRGRVNAAKSQPPSNYMMMCLRALVQLTMNHSQQLSQLMEVHCELESSFEWLSMLKYHLDVQKLQGSDYSSCYVDILGHRLQYGYEYVGSEDWVVLHTPSTDRAILGILLALTSYKCGFIKGPCLSGKKSTVVQLGKALGLQVVNIQCWLSMNLCVVQNLLLGALETGAWLVLDSVDLLTEGVLSSFGQHLEDIHQRFSEITMKDQGLNEEMGDRSVKQLSSGKSSVHSEYHIDIAGKRVSAALNYGCVLISSKGHAFDLPESLQTATRPIALTHPDYRIIAEVMLTSIGFIEGMALSHRLVSFMKLSKDSLCLPDIITKDQSCYLVILQNIISASEMHLKQSRMQQEILNSPKNSVKTQTESVSAQSITAEFAGTDSKKAENPPRFMCTSEFSVIQEETAIVKAILSILFPFIYEQKNASQFYRIFKDTFPIVCQFPFFKQYFDEEEKRNQVKDAVSEELQRKGFQPEANMIGSALTVYQAMKSHHVVILLGYTGSGKTTCYSALAGALNGLAAKKKEVFDKSIAVKRDTEATSWSCINPVVLFPNAMSHEELFGHVCEERGWQDGAVTKMLRESVQHEHINDEIYKKQSSQTPALRWLVMDGEPLGKPGWLDFLTTLCDPKDPVLCLSSSERIVPSLSNLKLVMEITDLSNASPSTVTRCTLVHFTGTDLWKSVWKSQMDALCCEYRLSQEILKMWNRLSEDLFANTLSLIRQKSLNSAIHSKEESCKTPIYGLQEIMSFVRILHALLQHFEKDVEKAKELKQVDIRADIHLHGTNSPGTDSQTRCEFLARNLFLVAYIWGFGGHLHPSFWPHFDAIAHQVLLNCRYQIEVPKEESVFEYFFSIDSNICPKNTHTTSWITSKCGKYSYLLNLMLEAKQPVLLAGEPGSGKSTLCKTFLSFDRPHVSLPASPLLNSRDLYTILSNISCQRTCTDAMSSTPKKSQMLLYLDDLHEAPCDAFGKESKALETLRQSISKGGILTFDSYCFKFLSSATISYMATCRVFGPNNHQSDVISPRLSRLFSIFVLPSLSLDVILAIHSPGLKVWLMPFMQNVGEMARCIITATKHLYLAVCDQFEPTAQQPHFIFSTHDLEKVFQGMRLWRHSYPDLQKKGFPVFPEGEPPGLPPEKVLNVVKLWIHECVHTFSDRLCTEDENKTLVELIAQVATTDYKTVLTGCSDDRTSVTHPAVKPVTQNTVMDSPNTLHQVQELKPSSVTHPEESQRFPEVSLQPENSREASLKTHPFYFQILQHLQDITVKTVYGPELSEVLNSREKRQNFSRVSYREQTIDVLVEQLSTFMEGRKEDKEHCVNNFGFTSKYAVHRQRVRQLLHIFRALLIPGGHGVLIGSDRGTGRKTTVRFAAYLTGCKLVEVHSGNENNMHEILKNARNQTREGGVHVIILVHEDISQCAREELLVAMAHRTYPRLCTDEELRNVMSRMTNSRTYNMDIWMFEKHLGQIHKNVHVFLLLPFTVSESSKMPADTSAPGLKAQMAKALSLSCCVELYQPWSYQSLVDLALQCLRTSPHEMTEGSESCLSVAMAQIHQSARQYGSALLTSQPFSPQTYLEFIAHFCYLCNHLHTQGLKKANRVKAVLARLDVMKRTALQYKHDLMRLQEKVAETQQHEQELLRAVNDHRKQLEEAQLKCVEQEEKLCQLEEQICDAKKQIRPVFQSGLKVLMCLSPSDVEEVRHYREPPEGVVKVMDAVCLLFNCPPGWESAKQLLGRPNLFEELEFFDRYSLTKEQLQQLGHIVHSPQFVPESVREVSKACESLCQWVQAVYECCSMQHQLLFKQKLQAQAAEAQSQLQLVRKKKEEAHSWLENVKAQLQSVRTDLEEQLLELHEAERMDKEAAAAEGQMEKYVRMWNDAAQMAELSCQTSAGDALVLAAIISYSGPFAPDIGKQLLSKWKALCQTGSIDINPSDPRTSLFTPPKAAAPRPPPGFPIAVGEKLQVPLGSVLGLSEFQFKEARLCRLLVKLHLWGCTQPWAQRWPLLANSQQHLQMSCVISGENAKDEEEYDMDICADNSELLFKLDQAAERGLRVLVTHMERAVPSAQFLTRLSRPAFQRVHPKFCLFLSTDLPVHMLSREIHPSILPKVNVVDLSLSSEEIQELVLTQLLQSERKELLIQHSQFQNDKQSLQDKLIMEEDSLMDYILQSNTALLDDSDFLPHVSVYQETTEKLKAEMEQLSEELESRDTTLLAAPRSVVQLAAALYQALQEVQRLSPNYYFSLESFMTVMEEAFSWKGRLLVSYTEVPRGLIQEITNRIVGHVLQLYRPRLFHSHAAVLNLLVCVTLMQHSQLCSEAERKAFLRGLVDITHPVTKVKPSSRALPSWIPPHIHPELLCLDQITAFRGLITSVSTSPQQWHEYLRFPSSTVTGLVPCRSHSHLSLLQRALLWKTLLPHSLQGLAEVLSTCHLYFSEQTARHEAPHVGHPEALAQLLLRQEGPIILTLPSPCGDKWTSIQPLYLIKQLARCVAKSTKVQVQVISVGALCDKELILSSLEKAGNNGHWLVFNNCHRLEQWDDDVVAQLNKMLSNRGTPRIDGLVGSCFRLWFITQDNAPRSLPVGVRMCALSLVCDSSWNLKEELSCTLRQMASIIQPPSPLSADNTQFLLRCAIFHSVLLQRQTYRYLGQGQLYHWSQADLLMLLDAYNHIASLCHNKSKALEYIAVNLVYGGHVLDSADLEVVQSVAKSCLVTEPPICGSGPHNIINIFSNPGHFDLSVLLQDLDQGLQDSDPRDSSVLGFSSNVAAEMVKINSRNLSTLLQISQTPLGAVRWCWTEPNQPVFTLPPYSHVRDRLHSLKTSMAHKADSADANAGGVCGGPLRDFVQTEWDDLIDSVSSLLSQIQQPVQYSRLTSASLLQIADLFHLERRAELLSAYLWHHNSSDPAGAYRLCAFKNARGFLMALMRQAAQVNRKFVSDIILHFQVLSQSTCTSSLPLESVYLCGLELRGALWDTEQRAIKDTVSPEPHPLPLVYVSAHIRNTNNTQDTFPSYLEDTSPSNALRLAVYLCPLYVDIDEQKGNWGLEDINIITKLPLRTCLNPELCNLRRVRLVSKLGGN
ncbi:dynein heavy chain domain-containing protein 1 [Sphaeramia orbicularis]|uniref:dynein heavy chain domain-containing protein 1 n=1 Tax=Sphaeramia orbicularis TaxID=375764 RepID=UPI00117CFFC5|nr:dynein heavy chain domain-containing protein 1-like [Sphaeramia orbicularis]